MNGRHGYARLWAFGLVLLAPVYSVWSSNLPRTRSPLIQLQGNEVLCTRTGLSLAGPACAAAILRERTILIFRNTRALSVTTEADYDVDRPIVRTPASSTLHDGFLSNQQVQELNDFLEGIAIESRRGQCNPFLGTPGFNAPFSSARYMVFWYGSDGQRAAVTFGSDFRSSCPPGGLLDLFNLLTRLGEAIQ